MAIPPAIPASHEFAIATVVCAADRKPQGQTRLNERVDAVLHLGKRLAGLGSRADRVLLASGLGPRVAKTLIPWWNVLDVSNEPALMEPILHDAPGYHWPRRLHNHTKNAAVQRRTDFRCTSLKLLAWNMTDYARVLIVDADVCMLSDPVPWMVRHRSEYFVAAHEPFGRWPNKRPYLGLNTHMVFLEPSRLLFRLLVDKGRTRSYVPYTNGEQDVVETVFADHADMPTLPPHTHKCPAKPRGKYFQVPCNCSQVESMSATERQPLVWAATASVNTRSFARRKGSLQRLARGKGGIEPSRSIKSTSTTL